MQNTPVIQLIDEAKNIAIKGSLCQEKGQLEEAAFYYQQALNQNPNLQQVNYNLGIIHYQQGDLLGAYQSYKKAIALKPDDINAYYNLGIVLQNQGLLISAIDSYQQAINLSKSEKSNSHETIVNCYSNWGCILLHQGQSDAAIAVFKEALLLKPDDFTIYNNIGQALLQKSQLDQAITYLKKSLKLEPQFTISLYHLGQVYQSQGLHEKAVKYFQQIIELEPENLTAYSESFYSLMEQGKLSEAMTNLQKAIQNNSFVEGYCKWSNLLAESTDELDKGKVAGANFLKALKNSNFPNSLSLKEISQYLIEIYLHLGNVSGESDQDEQAKIYYKKALELETVTAEEYVKLGKSLVKQNLINSAIIITNLGLETYPEHPEILENLQSLSKSKKAQKKPKFLSSSCERLNSRPWWEQNFQEFNMLHLGSRIYSCSENQTTTNILSQNNSLKRAETETFVAQLLSGRAWVVPQKKYGMINNAIAIINQDNQLVKELSWNEAGQLGCQNSDENKQEIFDLEELPELEKIDGKVAVLSGLYDHVYFHWMVDILPRLEILKLHGIDLKEIDFFLVSNYQMPFQRESLNVLGIPQNKIISSEQHPYIQAKKLIVPSFPGDLGRLTSWSLEFHRQVFLSRIKQEIFTENKTSSFYPERIYISRNNSRYRRVFNEEEVLLKLSEIGFVCIQPDSMNLKEQIAIFSHAKVIIGAHGSGLTNIIFSPRGTKVIELVSPNYIRHYYCGISQKIGLEHYYLKGEDFGCAPIRKLMYQNPLTEDIILNLNSLEKALKVLGIIEKKKILETVFSSEIKASIQKEQQVGIRKKISQEKKKLPMKQVGQKISLKVNSQEIAGQLNKQAELYLKQKELELAKTTCTQALKSQPDYSPACKTLGNVFYAQGQIETAWYWYTKAIEYQPNFAEAYANLGTLSVKKEQWQEAISYYQKALKIQPKFAGVYRNLARIYQKIGSYTEAEKFSIKAEYLEPVNQKITPENQAIKLTLYYKKLGKRLQSQGEVEAAWQSYKKFLSLEKNDPEIYLNIGSLYAQQEQWIEAIKCYQKSLVIQPNYADAYRQLAIAWRKVGKKTKGDNCLYQAYSLEPGKATAEEHLILGNSLLQQKVISQAISCYCRAIELNPNLLGAYESLGEALKLQGTKKPTTKVFPNYWQNLENSLNLLIGENHQNSQGIIQQVRADDTIHIIQKPENFQRVVSKGVSRVISTFDLKSDLSDSVNYLESSLSVLENSQDKRVTNYKEITKTLAPNKPLIIEADVTNVYGNIEGEKTVMNSPKKANNNQIIHSTLKLKEISKVNEVKQINSTFLLKDMTSNGVRNIPNVYIQEAQKYYEEGFYEKAISQCQQAISLKIDVAAAYIIIGDSQKKIGEIKQAESSYKTALEIQQSYGLIYIVLGNLYVEYKILNLVIYCYEKALEIKLKVAENYYKLAMVLTELGETLGVLDFWYQAYSLEPKKVTANDHFNLGNKLYEKGKIAQAVSCYQNSIELNPNLGTVYYNLSLGLKCLGRWDEAVIYYHKAKEIWADKNQNQNTLKVDMNSDISAKLEAEYENGYQLNSAKIKDKVGENKNQNQKSLKVDMNSDISAKLEAEYENGEQLNSAEIKDKVWENKNQNQKSLKGDVNFNISAKLEDKYQNGHQLSAAEIERKSGELLQLNQIVTNQINYSQKAEVKELLKQAKTYYLEGLFSEAIAICYSVIKVEKNSEAYQIMGKAFQQKNQLDNAINCYAQALKLNPNDSGANYEMGNILALLPGKLEEAITYYYKALEIDPYLTEAYYSLANIFVNQNQLKKAVIIYKKLIEIQPNIWENYHNLGNILIEQENFSEGISALYYAIKLNPSSSISYLKLAEILAKSGKLSEAINAYQKVIFIDPNLAEAYQYLGDILRNKGEKEEAIKVYRKAIEIQPQLWTVHHKLGSLFQETEKLEAATNAYRKSIELNPDFCWSYNNLGDVLVRLEKWSEAAGAYGRAIELNPDFCWSYNNLGDVLVRLEKWPEAAGVYHQAIELNPDFPWNYYNLGDVLVKLEDWEGAIIAYSQALEFKLELPEAKQKLDNALHQKVKSGLQSVLNYYLRAIEQEPNNVENYFKAIEIEPNNPELYFGLGNVWLEKKEFDQAITSYEKAIDINPNLGKVYQNLARVFQEKGREKEARESWFKALSLEASLATAEQHFNLGSEFLQEEQHREAVTCYRRAIALNPSFLEAYLLLGQVFRDGQKWSEAISVYRQGLKQIPENQELQTGLKETYSQQNQQQKIEENSNYSTQEIQRDLIHLPHGNEVERVRNTSIAAITMVSKNYLPQARTLCETFLEHHPQARFFVLLVDQVDGYFEPAQEQFQLLTMEDVPLPSADTFPYHYTILELNTAVKPFVLKYLLEKYDDIENLVYIDPDIQIFRPLDAIWNALRTNTTVLIPHMRKPFRDNYSPSEVQILQSGTYNLGFIGLKKNQHSLELLKWWMEKLHLDCVVDIPNGLFVDQKWMDLIPGYFPDTYILHDPSYNVAYWNLHDRTVEKIGDEYLVDGRPLAFFHFSGYSPKNRNKLSKHQTRHNLYDLPTVKELCDGYANKMLKWGYSKAKNFPYAYGKLPNGIKACELINYTLRQLIIKNIPFPSPKFEADEFCKFLMTPSPYLSGKNTPPIITSLLKFRPDVAAAFPNASNNFLDEGFINWLEERGATEHNIDELCHKFKQYWVKTNIIEDLQKILRRRTDVVTAYPNFVSDPQSYDRFCAWLKNSGPREENLKTEEIEKFKKARGGYLKILNLYFLRPDLQSAFCNIHLPKVREKFLEWLKSNLTSLPNIDIDECLWFDLVCEVQQKELTVINLLYNSYLRQLTGSTANLFEIDKIIKSLELAENQEEKNAIIEFLASEKAPTPLSQLEAFYRSQGLLKHLFPDAFQSKENLQELHDYLKENPNIHNLPSQSKAVIKWIDKLEAEIQTYGDDFVVNVAGNFDATTGMGQSARSMEHTLKAVEVNYSKIIVPNTYIDKDTFFDKENKLLLMGWPLPGKGANITVVNADSVGQVHKILPDFYWQGRKNIGYWVWETEELPTSQARAAKGFDEIWTPSEYSAAAIGKKVDKPVRVVPHVIDFAALDSITSDRSEFNLPTDQVLFGFFFDQKSSLERKNPRGLIKAFKKAFKSSEDVVLLLKVSSPVPGNYDYEMLKLESDGLNVIWIEETYHRAKTLRLMNCLDVYVSLHRSEGFGLTLAEAMAMGKPVIATKYSANLDFMDNSNSFLVEAEVIETDRSYGAYPRGTRWAEPDLDQAAEFMKFLCDRSVREKYGDYACKSIKDKLSAVVVASIFKKIFHNFS